MVQEIWLMLLSFQESFSYLFQETESLGVLWLFLAFPLMSHAYEDARK